MAQIWKCALWNMCVAFHMAPKQEATATDLPSGPEPKNNKRGGAPPSFNVGTRYMQDNFRQLNSSQHKLKEARSAKNEQTNPPPFHRFKKRRRESLLIFMTAQNDPIRAECFLLFSVLCIRFRGALWRVWGPHHLRQCSRTQVPPRNKFIPIYLCVLLNWTRVVGAQRKHSDSSFFVCSFVFLLYFCFIFVSGNINIILSIFMAWPAVRKWAGLLRPPMVVATRTF